MYKSKVPKILAKLNNILMVTLIVASVIFYVSVAAGWLWPYAREENYAIRAAWICVFYGMIFVSGCGFAAWVLNRCLAGIGSLALRLFNKLNGNA